jgi:hypothetical protein
VHYEFAPEGLTFNQDFYLAVLRSMRDTVRRKRPEMWTARSWFFQHNNKLRKHFNTPHTYGSMKAVMQIADRWLGNSPKVETTFFGSRCNFGKCIVGVNPQERQSQIIIHLTSTA